MTMARGKEIRLGVRPGESIRITVKGILETISWENEPRNRTENDALGEIRALVRENYLAFRDLLGRNPKDEDNLLMDQGERIVKSVVEQRKFRISRKRFKEEVGKVLKEPGNLSPEQVDDLARTITGFFSAVGENIPRKK